MAITFVGFGTIGKSITNPATSPGMPAFSAGDRLVLLVGGKATTPPTVTQPAGWLAPSDNTVTGGTGAAGASTGGPVRLTLFYLDAVGGEGAPTIDLSAAASPTSAVVLAYRKAPGDTWGTFTCAVAADTTGSTTDYDPPAAAITLPLGAGDWLCAADFINDEQGTTTVPGTTTVAGVTLGAANSRIDDPTTIGNDARLIVDDYPYSSGTASAGPDRTVAIAGAIANMSGASIFWVLTSTTPGGPAYPPGASARRRAVGRTTRGRFAFTAAAVVPAWPVVNLRAGGRRLGVPARRARVARPPLAAVAPTPPVLVPTVARRSLRTRLVALTRHRGAPLVVTPPAAPAVPALVPRAGRSPAHRYRSLRVARGGALGAVPGAPAPLVPDPATMTSAGPRPAGGPQGTSTREATTLTSTGPRRAGEVGT